MQALCKWSHSRFVVQATVTRTQIERPSSGVKQMFRRWSHVDNGVALHEWNDWPGSRLPEGDANKTVPLVVSPEILL
jgi:hypothetical protein